MNAKIQRCVSKYFIKIEMDEIIGTFLYTIFKEVDQNA